MKRFIASILLLVYCTVNTGFVVSAHYCMDRFEGIQLGAAESKECGKCGMHKDASEGCCRDEVKVVMAEQDQLFAKTVAYPLVQPLAILYPSAHLAAPFYNFILSPEAFSLLPPLLSKQDTYLSNRVFRL